MNKGAIGDALAAAMVHSRAPMALSDPDLPDTPMVAINQAFVDPCGYPHEDLIGRNCRFLQGPRTDPDSAPRIRASLDAGQGCIEWIVNHRRDGSAFWNLLFISPIRSEEGKLLFFFDNQLDITKGFPDWLMDVSFGRAHVAPELEQEFHALLRDIAVHAAGRPTGDLSRTQALERIIGAAHRVAEISTQLAPGTLNLDGILP